MMLSRTLVWKIVTIENKIASSAATNHATVLPAKLQKARASNAPATKMILRAVQYFRPIALRNSPLRLNRAICLSSCSKRVMLVEHNLISVEPAKDHDLISETNLATKRHKKLKTKEPILSAGLRSFDYFKLDSALC